MAGPPPTRPSLLLRIRDPRDAEAWRQFVRIYAPVVHGYARGRGLQDADSADLTQEVLRSVSAAAAGFDYDPGRGSFRGWLLTVAHHRLHDFLTRGRRGARGSGDTGVQRVLEQHAAGDADAELWDREYEKGLFAWAADEARGQFQERTWRAFWLTAVEGRPGRDVAGELGMSTEAVYLAKGRVLARLRELIRQAEEG